MDDTWKTSAWEWEVVNDDKNGDSVCLFRCRPKSPACAFRGLRNQGSSPPTFAMNTCKLETKQEWDDWLDEVSQPNAFASATEGSLNLLIFPRAPDTKVGRNTLRNPLNLTYVPVPNASAFIRLIETFHVHQATQTIINRGWPIIIRSEDLSGPDRIIHYNLRTTNTLEHDTALTITHIPSKNLIYAIYFGYTERQITTVLERLTFAGHALLEPSTLINAFIQLEKVQRFEQVQRHADGITKLIKNFQDEAAVAGKSGSSIARRVQEDDPRDLVGLAGEMRLLRNGLVSWARELARFREKAGGNEFPRCVGGDGKLPLLDVGEYLDRTVDEYEAMVRRCEGMLEQVSMTFQMETSSIARQEVNKMKALAILTMVFLPATFVATFMSMGLFNWHAKEDEAVMSRYWWVYLAVAGGLTLFVLLTYRYWSRLWSLKGEKSDREMA
ncbi:hypothetical protein B0T14DRAFT_607077 [Immersiella caudata]|uniref:Uncharacterized protein n=1 Tax=Immersiella caudata TaxID=314043 RepID=A0AA39TH73_9PEZI|nr:hypothetical protein B0T14DRAFT_607077 [Immersiella caudata]